LKVIFHLLPGRPLWGDPVNFGVWGDIPM